MKCILLLALILPLAGVCPAFAAPKKAAAPVTMPLWPDGAPGAKGTKPHDVPTLTHWPAPADKATHAAIVVCPGGGYGHLAVDHEGKLVAEWLNSFGVSAFVLRYRHAPHYRHPAPIQDAQRAVRTVRAKAKEWHVDPAKIGILGFSAGGHLASTAGTHFDAGKPDATDPIDRVSCRPDFMVLVYPVIAISTKYGHAGSRRNLLGPKPDEKLVKSLSNELQVTPQTPPTFLMHSNGDTGVPAENSVLFFLALRKAKVPAEMHVFGGGYHGFGLADPGRAKGHPSLGMWPDLCRAWMIARGFLPKAKSK